jgi:hypothetical protein
MGIEDGLGEAADQAKKIVTGTDENKQNEQDDDPDMEATRQAERGSFTEGQYKDHSMRNMGTE